MTTAPVSGRAGAPLADESASTGTALSVTLVGCRLIAGGLFIAAAVIKLTDLQSFAFSVKGFQIFPDSAEHLTMLATFAFPWLELICGAMLVLGLWTRAAALVTVLLLLSFVGAIISVIARGMSLECGCFGKLDFVCDGPLGWCSVARNLVHASIAAVPLILGAGRFGIDALVGPATRS
ncbi:MAG: MauE/DoxX family redox-associated membrane protein [Planctomycetota bacterium]